MGSNQQIFGRTSITINGVNFDSKPGAKLKMGGVKKEAVQGDNKTYFKRMKVPWVINADFIVTAETDIKTLTTEDGITASYTFDTGQSYTGHDGEIMHRRGLSD